jgi:hypothetical protein
LRTSWWFDFACPEFGGYASLEFGERRARWAAAFVGAGWPLVAVRADDIHPQRPEFRTDGLWGSVTEDQVGMEAFGAVFDDPAEAWGEERGDIVPFGFDLQWDGERCSGDVLIGDDRIEVDCPGSRTPLVGVVAPIRWLSPVKPDTVHALCDVDGVMRWVSWYDQTSLPPGSPG